MKKNYTLNIGGTSFGILSDDPEEYIRGLEAQVNDMLDSAALCGASSYKAALFVCMELCDMLEKSKSENPDVSKKQKKNCEQVLFPVKGQTSLF